ncbi:phage tail protein [Aeromonas dhakensis]|uniref:phage tail protein n=1 Tax=Aeromonas dhakensis TaxID=196024 RepID=UPI002B489754|nr:phage tail protein [Aeromonas dhakensis]
MSETNEALHPQGYFLSALHRELERVLPARCARSLDSWMEGGTLSLEPKDMGITGMDLAWLKYTAVFSLESLPFRECRTETLLAVIASWIQENDPFRERFALPDPTYDVVPNDEHSADLDLEVKFAEPLRIVEDPDGAVRWLDKTWTVAPFEVWVADEITLSVAGSAHPVHC